MKELKFTWWKTEHFFLGYLNEYPDYMTQGETYEELKENLIDLHADLASGVIPCVRHHAELELA